MSCDDDGNCGTSAILGNMEIGHEEEALAAVRIARNTGDLTKWRSLSWRYQRVTMGDSESEDSEDDEDEEEAKQDSANVGGRDGFGDTIVAAAENS